MVIAWINKSLEPTIVANYLHQTNAMDFYLILKAHYNKFNGLLKLLDWDFKAIGVIVSFYIFWILEELSKTR